MGAQAYRKLLLPEADAFYKTLEGRPKLHDKTPQETRKEEAAGVVFRRPENISKIDDAEATGRAGHKIPVRIYTPQGPGPFPLIMHFHGGGFYCGCLDSMAQLAADYASFCGAVCCSVGYRLCPEDPFPAGVDDCWDALMWATHPEQARYLNIDRTKVAVAGESAGGNLAAVMALQAKQEGLRVVQAQILVCAVTDLTGLNTKSHEELSEELFCSSHFRRRYHQWYMPDFTPEQKSNPLLSPHFAKDLSKLPPAFVLTAEVDGLKDEGKEYAEQLEAAGVRVKFKEYKGMVNTDMFPERARDTFLEIKAWLHTVWDMPLT